MRAWIYVMEETVLRKGRMAPVYPLGMNIVIARVDGTLYAVSGICTHMACPLFTGDLDGFTLTCRCHDWRYDIPTGHFIDAPELGLPVYSVKAEGGKLFVSLE